MNISIDTDNDKDTVKTIQTILNLDQVDGIFGKGTEKAVKEFQSTNNLPCTGIVDETTWNLLTLDLNKEEKSDNSNLSDMISLLEGHVPDVIYDELEDCCDTFDIDTPLKLSHFLAQCYHESMGFTRFEENLNYTKVERVVQIFKKYMDLDHNGCITQKELDNAVQYTHDPEKLANLVYANRMGNGDVNSGDGYKYRGRGCIQLTGKSNYALLDEYITDYDILENPDSVATTYALIAAGFYWNENNLNDISSKGSSMDVVKAVTKKVNGGYIGIEERYKQFNKFYNILNS